MINTKFEAYKLRRELRKIGKFYEFKRAELNEFKEPTETQILVYSLLGLYHEQNGYIKIMSGDMAQIRSKKMPMILCLYEDAKSLKCGDVTSINQEKFKVTGIINVQDWNIIADISLEVIDNGI